MTPIVSATLLRTQSDERLLALARQGYERAFEAIVERYRRAMMRYCRRYLPEARAEDAVQQAFLSAWSAIREGTEVADLRAWLYRITRNAAIDAAKRAGYDYSELSEALRLAPAPEGELERRAVMRETLAGVAALPANQREALLRTVVEGQSRADIARELQISEGAVRQLIYRARTALRSAATALTPTPAISWAALGGGDAPVTARITELAAGGGAAGGTGLLIKTGTVVAVAGVLAVEAGTRLEHPSTAAGDSVRDQPHAHVAGARSHLVPASVHARTHRRAATGLSLARPARKAVVERRAAGGAGDGGPGRANRAPGSIGPIADSLAGESEDAQTEGSGERRDSGGAEGDRDGDNSGPGSESSGPGDGDGDGDDSGSGSSGSDRDEDHSGSGSDGGDSGGDKSGSDHSGSDRDGGSGDNDSGD